MTARILVSGIAVLDFVYQVDPLPVHARKHFCEKMEIVGGGCAANAAVAIQRLGGKSELIARLGRDEIGQLIKGDLSAEGVGLDRLEISEDGRSSASSVFVDADGERMIVNFPGSGLIDRPEKVTGPKFDAVLADTRWNEAAEIALAHAKAEGIPSVLDGEAPVVAELAEAATHVVFSETGIQDFTGESDVAEAVLKAAERLPGWVAATAGERGVFWAEGGSIRHFEAFRVEAVDTLGAGDVWHGAFALRLAEGADELDALQFASAAAALKCREFGGRKATPGRGEVETLLKDMV